MAKLLCRLYLKDVLRKPLTTRLMRCFSQEEHNPRILITGMSIKLTNDFYVDYRYVDVQFICKTYCYNGN